MTRSTRKAMAKAGLLSALGCAMFAAAMVAPPPASAAQPRSDASVPQALPAPAGDAGETGFAERMERAWQYHTINQRVRDNMAPPVWLPAGDRFLIWAA